MYNKPKLPKFCLKLSKCFRIDYDFLRNNYDCNVLHPLWLKDTFKKKDGDHVFSKVAQTAEQLPLTLNTLCYAQHFRSIKGTQRRESSCNFSKNSSNLRSSSIFFHTLSTQRVETLSTTFWYLPVRGILSQYFNTVVTTDLRYHFLCYVMFSIHIEYIFYFSILSKIILLTISDI